MPEGPEVYLLSKILNRGVSNQVISSIKITKDSRFKKQDFSFLKGKKIKLVSSKGKKIIFMFTDGSFLVSSLGLEGWWNIDNIIDSRNVSVVFNLKSGKTLFYQDQRHFGELKFYQNLELMDKAFSKTVGISWISSELYPEEITKDIFFELLSKSKKMIMMFLVDQSKTSGIGNYIRSDVLFLAGISPFRYCKDISAEKSYDLFEKIKFVINESIKKGGLREYSNDERGEYKFYVYSLSETSNNLKIMKEYDKQKRSIYWVPEIQK